MNVFTINSKCCLKLVDSDYDESVEGVVVADLQVKSNGKIDRIFEIRLIDLADALRSVLFKCLLQEGEYSESLWDTGECVGMRRISVGQVAVELPIGIGAINVEISEVGDFITLLYTEALAALLAHAEAKA